MATKKKKNNKAKKALKKKTAPKKKALAKKAAPKKKKAAPKKHRTRGKRQIESSVTFDRAGLGADAGGQSGDLQGLSNAPGADSESVDELLEEGNAFEAEVVDGVQKVRDADEDEVRTREVPEDDVPDEYLDEDK
jgi:hypothetical protein